VLQLGHTLIDVNTSFFRLGGNSLTSLHLLMLLRKSLKLNLNVAEFFNCSTVALLAARAQDTKVDGSGPRSETSARLFTLQEGPVSQQEAPHFLLHGAGASGLAFRSLVMALHDLSRSTFAVEDASLDGSAEFTFSSIVNVAEAYGEEILTKLKEVGSMRCRLSGWSYGGVVAIEVVRKLEAAGIDVEALSLFDAPIRGSNYEGDVDAEYEEEEQLIRDSLVQSIGASGEIARLLADRAVEHWQNCTALLRRHVTRGEPQLKVRKVAHFVVREASAARSPVFLDDCLLEPAEVVEVDGVHWTMLAEAHAPSLAASLSTFWNA
jgi:thioesterase domain-containing protein/acyl carrier protein